LDECVVVTRRHLRGRGGQQGGERPEHKRRVVGADQLGVVGGDGARVAVVVHDLQGDLVAEQPAALVDLLHPQVVAPLERLAVHREVAGQRERRADQDRGLGGAAATAAGTAAAAAGGQDHRRGRGGGKGQEPGAVRSHPVLLPVQV